MDRGIRWAAVMLAAGVLAGGAGTARAQGAGDPRKAAGRVLGPEASDRLRERFAAAAPAVRLKGARVEPAGVRASVCADGTGGESCGTVVLADAAAGCSGTVAGPWCVAFEAWEPPEAARRALLAALGAPGVPDPWTVPRARPEAEPADRQGGPEGGAGPARRGPPGESFRASGKGPPAWVRDAALPVVLWAALLLAGVLLAQGVVCCGPPGGWRRADALWALVLAGLSLALRLALGHEGPINFVEADRLPLDLHHSGYAVSAALGVPLARLLGDPVAGAAWTNLLASAAAPVVAAVVGTLWWGRRAGAAAGLLLAAAPTAIRWSRTTDAGVLAALLVLAAVAAVEVAGRRPGTRGWWTAGAAWALAILVRPEGVVLVLPLAALLLLDAPLRATLRRGPARVALGVPVVLALALRMALTMASDQPVGLDLRFPLDTLHKGAAHLGRLLDPSVTDPGLVALALAGTMLARGGRWAFAVLAGWVLPPLLPALAGIGDVADHNTRYVLAGLPFVCLLAGAAVERGVLWAERAGLGGRGRVAAAGLILGVALRGLLVDPWLPSPLQAQGRFLAEVASGLPEGALLLAAGDPSDPGSPAVAMALGRAGRAGGSPDPGDCRHGRGVTVADVTLHPEAAAPARAPAGCPVFHLRGAWSLASPEAAAADRALAEAGWSAEPVAVRQVEVRDPRDGRPASLELGLWRLLGPGLPNAVPDARD